MHLAGLRPHAGSHWTPAVAYIHGKMVLARTASDGYVYSSECSGHDWTWSSPAKIPGSYSGTFNTGSALVSMGGRLYCVAPSRVHSSQRRPVLIASRTGTGASAQWSSFEPIPDTTGIASPRRSRRTGHRPLPLLHHQLTPTQEDRSAVAARIPCLLLPALSPTPTSVDRPGTVLSGRRLPGFPRPAEASPPRAGPAAQVPQREPCRADWEPSPELATQIKTARQPRYRPVQLPPDR